MRLNTILNNNTPDKERIISYTYSDNSYEACSTTTMAGGEKITLSTDESKEAEQTSEEQQMRDIEDGTKSGDNGR